MLRETLVVDGTAKTCKGVIAGLERGMSDLATSDVVLAIVDDIPTRLDVYAWAQRKSHRIVEERRHGSGYVLYIAKGGSHRDPRREGTRGDPVRSEAGSIEAILPPEL